MGARRARRRPSDASPGGRAAPRAAARRCARRPPRARPPCSLSAATAISISPRSRSGSASHAGRGPLPGVDRAREGRVRGAHVVGARADAGVRQPRDDALGQRERARRAARGRQPGRPRPARCRRPSPGRARGGRSCPAPATRRRPAGGRARARPARSAAASRCRGCEAITRADRRRRRAPRRAGRRPWADSSRAATATSAGVVARGDPRAQTNGARRSDGDQVDVVDDAEQAAVGVEHRQVADAAVEHLHHRLGARAVGGHGPRRGGHDLALSGVGPSAPAATTRVRRSRSVTIPSAAVRVARGRTTARASAIRRAASRTRRRRLADERRAPGSARARGAPPGRGAAGAVGGREQRGLLGHRARDVAQRVGPLEHRAQRRLGDLAAASSARPCAR